MKTSLLVIFLTLVLAGYGQGVIGEDKNALIEAYDIAGKRIPLGSGMEPEGSKMLNDQYTAGVVKFSGIPSNYHLLINFSLLDNELFFKKDSMVLAFANRVDSFSIIVRNKGEEKTMNFKRGFPAIGSYTGNSFYQLVAVGPKVKLLKYLYRIKEERYSYGGPSTSEYADRSKLYALDVAGNSMAEIKPNVQSIEKALPRQASQIEKFTAGNKIKKEEDVSALFSFINLN